MNRKIILVSTYLFVFIYSCKEQNKLINENDYLIVSELITKYGSQLKPPPPPLNNNKFHDKKPIHIKGYVYSNWINKIDSIEYVKKHEKILANSDTMNSLKKNIIVIDTSLNDFNLGGYDYQKTFADSYKKQLLGKLIVIQSTLKMNLKEIKLSRKNDSLIYFDKKKHVESKALSFQNINSIFRFSKIVYNDDKTKAALILSSNRGRLNGFLAICFLEKKESKWKVIETKTLEVS